MTENAANWRRERRELPGELIAAAAANPGGSVAEIDGSMVSDPDGYVPAEAIVGVYVVGEDGVATGEYLHNPRYGPVRDEFDRLESPDHWLGWLPTAPREAVRAEVESALAQQVQGARIEWFKVVEDPAFLTGGVRSPGDPSEIVVRRAGVAVPFALSVLAPSGRRDVLTGVFSWVAANLDLPGSRRDRTWLDLGKTKDEGAAALQSRIYELDDA